ncbi:Uncharacterized protein GBIM_11601 [Gryllus bimaculatus]|nr:Uncharacterized protein GBIM_11601 [Gryllus bimaculatus]
MRGIIVRVRLRHFMVFTDIEMTPGRNVNVIIAPNGCGKSSLISGIMLGLCGKPQDIGRAAHVGDYIKTGCSEANIEVELFNPGGNYIIERNINRANKSVWFLNGERVSQKQVEDLMATLHIQVSNLCQVLPQDRVYEFSRMDSKTLLESTEKSVGPEILLRYHTELKEMSKTRGEYEQKVKDQSAKLDREISTNRSLQTAVEMMKKKDHFMEKIRFFKQQRAWVVYREQYTLVQENDEKLQLEVKLQSTLGESMQQKEALERVDEKFDEAKNAEVLRLKELEQLRQHLSKLECDLANYSSVSEKETKERIDKITANMSVINQKLTEIRHEEEILQDSIRNVKHRIMVEEEKKKRLEDKANQRLKYVKEYLPEVYQAIIWLRKNTHEFAHKIFEPMMLVIDVKNDSYVKYLESAIPRRDLQAFICEDKEDMNKFISIMREQLKLSVNILYSGPEHHPSSWYTPKVPLEELKKYGFTMFVRDMFSAPETIMKYLCRTAGVHRIPVGESFMDDALYSLPLSLTIFFSGINKYTIQVSKYTNERCFRIISIPPARMLSCGGDSNEVFRIDECIQKLLEEKRGLDGQLSSHQQNKQEQEKLVLEMRDERRKLQAGIGGKDLTERRIKSKKDQIASVIITNLCGIDEKVRVLAEKLDRGIREFAEINWNLHERKEHLKKRENDVRSTLRASAHQEDVVRALGDQYTKARNEAMQFHEEALRYTNGKAPDESFYKLITDDRDTLSRKIQELQAKADFMNEGNSNIRQEYEKRKKTIGELTDEIQMLQKKLGDINKSLLVTREKWLPELQKLINKINENFGKYFARLGCAGEILLNCDDPDNYDTYGINIKVKFRDGDKLQDLNSFTQSGGERSVSTALYMIAMQEITHVPFRCVDEINQGMDAVNERRVFELLANAPADENTPQYFLLTPKLLPHLTYSRSMTVTCIMNGTVQKMRCWKIAQQVEARKKRSRKIRTS